MLGSGAFRRREDVRSEGVRWIDATGWCNTTFVSPPRTEVYLGREVVLAFNTYYVVGENWTAYLEYIQSALSTEKLLYSY